MKFRGTQARVLPAEPIFRLASLCKIAVGRHGRNASGVAVGVKGKSEVQRAAQDDPSARSF